MRKAIHNQSKIKDRLSIFWVDYCLKQNNYLKVVNCFDSAIISQLEDCDGLLFHFCLGSREKMLFAENPLHKKNISIIHQ